MSRCMAVGLILFMLTLPALADESAVYESLSRLSIGRVFYTQAERDLLDERRQKPSEMSRASTKEVSRAKTTSKNKNAAGYIVSASGRTRIWRQGDFVAGSKRQREALAFPGEVSVKRHKRDSANED